jgi:peptidoglycan hydrolase CwlO-like protein
MNSNHPERRPSSGAPRLAWLVAVIACGLVILGAALTFDLHNQKRRLENMSALLKETVTVRETDSNSLGARSATVNAALSRLRDLATERQGDLKRLGDLYAQREPLAKQAADAQDKIQEMAKDLVDLAKTDPDAKEIARKYNIQPTAQSSGNPSPKP